MERFIGIDVHSRSSTVAIMGPSGKRIRCSVVETSAAALIELLKAIPGERQVCIEEGTQSSWLSEVLRPYVSEVVVEGTNQEKDRSEPKNDERDAWGLAERLRTGTVRTRVYKTPAAMAGLREAVRAYGLIVGDVVRVKNRLRGVFRARGILVEGDALYRPDSRAAHLTELPDSSRWLAKLLGDELDGLQKLRADAEEWLIEQGKHHPAVERLQTAPGFGPLRAAQVVAVGITPHRFRTLRHFWSYCGLGIVMRSSADWVRDGQRWVRSDNVFKTRGLSRRRNAILKSVFKGAATTVVGRMTNHPLTQKYQALCAAGTRPPLAMLTVARKIAAAVFAMWKTEEVYDRNRSLTPQLA